MPAKKSDLNVQFSGERNIQFGAYRNLCCGQEIVINRGTTFPRCPKHPKFTIEWVLVVDDGLLARGKAKDSSAA
jgi:hypothetical protein